MFPFPDAQLDDTKCIPLAYCNGTWDRTHGYCLLCHFYSSFYSFLFLAPLMQGTAPGAGAGGC